MAFRKVARAELPALLLVAFASWFVLFSPWTAGTVNFWLGMLIAGGLLAGCALALDGRRLLAGPGVYEVDLSARPRSSHLAAGILAALLLYALFWIGDQASRWLLPFAGRDIQAVYARRASAPLAGIGLALLHWIGPAEEIFWRGFVQRRLMRRWGAPAGYLVASGIYAGAHLASGNLMLVAAALLCGLFWGAIYMRFKSLWPSILSHALWDVMVFVWLPLG